MSDLPAWTFVTRIFGETRDLIRWHGALGAAVPRLGDLLPIGADVWQVVEVQYEAPLEIHLTVIRWGFKENRWPT